MPIPHAFDAQLGGRRRNIAITFDTEKKLECGYPTVKEIEDIFIRFDRIHERTNGRTDRRRPDNGIGRAYA